MAGTAATTGSIGDSVSASMATGWSNWARLGGRLTSSPAIAVSTDGTLDVVVRGTDAALYLKTFAGRRWSKWTRLGGRLTSAPAIASRNGQLDVVVRGTDNAMYHKTFDGRHWLRWTRLGGRLTSAPAIAASPGGRLDVVVRGTDSAMYHKTFDGRRWSNWMRVGGNLKSAPGIAASLDGTLAVVTRGADNTLRHKSYKTGNWSKWEKLGGRLTSAPGIAASGNNSLDVVVRGTDNAMYQRTREGGRWSKWIRIGGTLASAPGITASADGTLDVVVRGTDRALYHIWGRGQAPPGPLGPPPEGRWPATGSGSEQTKTNITTLGAKWSNMAFEIRHDGDGCWISRYEAHSGRASNVRLCRTGDGGIINTKSETFSVVDLQITQERNLSNVTCDPPNVYLSGAPAAGQGLQAGNCIGVNQECTGGDINGFSGCKTSTKASQKTPFANTVIKVIGQEQVAGQDTWHVRIEQQMLPEDPNRPGWTQSFPPHNSEDWWFRTSDGLTIKYARTTNTKILPAGSLGDLTGETVFTESGELTIVL